MMVTIEQAVPSRLPPLDPGVHLRRTPAWTDLVQEENGKYKQTSQRPELNTCLGAAVKSATAKLVLFDAFPSLHVRDKWALDSLRAEFSMRQVDSPFIDAVEKRSSVDKNYLLSLHWVLEPLSSDAGCARLRARLEGSTWKGTLAPGVRGRGR